MRIPGFNSTASIYPTISQFHLDTSVLKISIIQLIVPQFRSAFNCSPCINGLQICCPSSGFEISCNYRRCKSFPLP